ncbi:thioredoxin reductase 1, mitochondrial [Tribolium castaneum]|uniref:Thioredoxin reductase 1, mitochondrial-like Protein n=1 Tax=Tribolium castaneum TaxID=7070 RepID=D2A2J2_TRICA|nr:PREDICTED: thioredoxin reductase 1, mitochondrial [Tribolium castaneum]EFA02207.2 Thioredoxin reductase 1, mitochondrial-like Protein [Tribolium castaneum]|eukprot:XP_008191785.1 PREDICTED: thioredoxin reductase 1, mitochondrial [Tribolium castaneum]
MAFSDKVLDLFQNFYKAKLLQLTHFLKDIRHSFRFYASARPEFDLIVIGGGSGGLAAAKEAAELGAKVAVFDFIVPSARSLKWGLEGEAVQDARSYGFQFPKMESLKHNWKGLRETVQNHIKSINWVTKIELRDKRVEYINSMGVFHDPYTIEAKIKNEWKTFKAKYFLISVGGRPKYPDIPGAELGISSDEVFGLENAPGKTLIIGAGYVGVECAGFLKGLGYDITVMVRSVVLRAFDQQMAKLVTESMVAKGVRFLHKCVPTSIERSNGKMLLVKWIDETREEGCDEFQTVLFAIGREACIRALRLDKAGVSVVADGDKIETINEQTNVPHIYAVGDVLYKKPDLTQVAIHAGKLLARRLFAKSTVLMDYDNIATTIFTPLEYGSVGLCEETAIERYGEDNIEIYHAYYKPTEFFIPQKTNAHCYLKVVAKRGNQQKVLGMHFVGPQAGEVIQGFSAAIKCNLTVDNLRNTVGIHPAIAEEFSRINLTKRLAKDPFPVASNS